MERPLNISQNDWFLLCQKYKNIQKIVNLINEGYPVQYLIGYVDFYGVNINVNKHVLIPRYETEYLVQKTMHYINKYFNRPIKIVDAGTGSGCIAIKLKQTFSNNTVIAFDKSFFALRLAKINAESNNVHIKFYWNSFNKFYTENVDVLIANPPYISDDGEIDDNVKKYEPKRALFAKNNGLKYYDELIRQSLNYLNTKSLICLEIGNKQAINIKKIIKKYYPYSKILIDQDLNKKDRYIFVMNNI